MESRLADVHAAEELAISSVLEGEDARDFVAEIRSQYIEFRRSLFWILVAKRESRDEVTLAVRRVKGASPFALWLLPMLEYAQLKSWKIEVHLPGETGSGWPAERVWGPPHDAEWLLTKLSTAPDTLDRMLLRVQGVNSAILLPLESGLHRYRGYSNNENGDHLEVEVLAQRVELDKEEWCDSNAALPATRSVARKAKIARERNKSDQLVLLPGGRSIDLSDFAGGYFGALEVLGLETLLHLRDHGGIERHYRGSKLEDEIGGSA